MAQITIGNQILHAIDPRIYSHFIEELGECIHNGIWVYSDALKNFPILEDPQLDLVRQDVFQSMYDIVGGQASIGDYYDGLGVAFLILITGEMVLVHVSNAPGVEINIGMPLLQAMVYGFMERREERVRALIINLDVKNIFIFANY